MRQRTDRKHGFVSLFDENTGFYARSGVFQDGKETSENPFMSSFPELLDVGIMGHCLNGETGLCAKAGVQCYQSGRVLSQPNMSIEDFEDILGQCKGKTYQFALGGRGDPDMHENFEELLSLCRTYDIVPNFTTSGFCMTQEKAALCAKYCGAVAVSWYRSAYTRSAIQMLLKAGVKTNIHYVLGRNTIEEAIERLAFNLFPTGTNAVIFLLHKPVGLGQKDNVLQPDDPRLARFFSLVDNHKHPFRIGIDSCSVPGILNYCKRIQGESLDTCEGGRWSAYISPDMKMRPCSFDSDAGHWAVDLRTHTIQGAWDSPEFDDFRNRLRNSCPDCPKRNDCMGGCPIVPEIVLCESKQVQNSTITSKDPPTLTSR